MMKNIQLSQCNDQESNEQEGKQKQAKKKNEVARQTSYEKPSNLRLSTNYTAIKDIQLGAGLEKKKDKRHAF